VTWESRYVLELDQPFSGNEPFAPDDHVEDMIRILAALSIDTCWLVGYCSGAGISLCAAAKYPERFPELVLVSGEYQLFRRKGHESTDYQRSIDTFMPVVAGGRQQAQFIFATMTEISQVRNGDAQSELERQIKAAFSREESLFRYAKNYMGYREFDALTVAARVRQPTFVLAGGRDEHSNMENSAAVAAAIPGSKTFVDPAGDHYEFCRAGSPILAALASYLADTVQARRAAGATVTIGTSIGR
jgi:pimeloyl-ACP methyl ester carboxylesterase